MDEQQQLPEGWKWVKLGDYVHRAKGKKPKSLTSQKTKEHYIPYVNIKAFESNEIEQYTNGEGCVLCEDGDFLMVWDGSRSGFVGKAIKGALGSTLMKLDFSEIDNTYAYYYLQSKFRELNTRAKGVGIPHVDPHLLWNFRLLVPPIDIQRSIVSKVEELFSELDNGIDNLRLVRQQLAAYRRAVLKWAFEGRLTNKESKENKLPVGWMSYSLKEVCQIQRGRSQHRPRNEPSLYGGKYPFVQTGDIRNAKGSILTNYTQTYNEKGLSQSRLWPKETLCITIAANIGETAILGIDACFPDSVVGLICKPELLLNKFLHFFFVCNKSSIEQMAPATAQKNINVEILERLTINLPLVKEQDRIVAKIEERFSVIDDLEKTIEHLFNQAQTLRQSTLKQAFEGNLVGELSTFKKKMKKIKSYVLSDVIE